MDIKKEALELHSKLKGKLEVKSKVKITRDNLKLLYTPGVASVSLEIAHNKEKAWEYTGKGNTIAIVSDGTRVLGLGNVGPEAALPVMEGKALLFKEYGDVNAIPLCIKTQEAQEIINFVRNIAPSFGAINIEDIESPKVLSIVEFLSQNLEIPVFHDDQQGTAIAVLAALINALKVVKKSLGQSKIVIVGAGTAGYGIANLLSYAGAHHLIVVDSKGIIGAGRKNLDFYKRKLLHISNSFREQGSLADALKGADACICVSGKIGILHPFMIESMASKPIVFALSNPDPEILPQDAKNAGAFIVATGRSDFPNQVNNVLVFPFLMKKILKERIHRLTPQLFYHTALKIANKVKNPTPSKIIPSIEELRGLSL
jgi:malate dehydrogenase (oxaloacetate-decarboxylating)